MREAESRESEREAEDRLNSGDWRLEQRRRAETREKGKIFSSLIRNNLIVQLNRGYYTWLSSA